MWKDCKRLADKVEAGHLQQRMNEQSRMTFSVIDKSVSSELNWNILSQFCCSQDFRLAASHRDHTRTLSYLPANFLKNDCSSSTVSLELSSDASPAWGSRCPWFITRQCGPVVARQQWAFPHQLFCWAKEQIRWIGELQVCSFSSGVRWGQHWLLSKWA